MAQVSASIYLNDLMSGPMMGIINTMDIMINAMDSVRINSQRMFSTSTIYQMHNSLDMARAQVDQITNGMNAERNAQNQVNNAIRGQNNALSGVIGQIKAMAGAYLSVKGIIMGTKAAINFSDELTNNTSRLNLMNDGLQTTQQFQDDIFAAAQEARTDYLGLQNAVAQLGIRAGGVFDNNQETLQFAKNLSKEFAIAGASQQEQASATLQLTQALGSGVLRGEEFNAVFESASPVMQEIADYLEVPIGQLKDMASEGEITADIVKNALLGATDSIDKKFNAMNLTFEQRMTRLANSCKKEFEPVGKQINGLVNSPEFADFMQNVVEGFKFIADVASNAVGFIGTLLIVLNGVFDAAQKVGNFIYNNWSIISPIIWGIIGALSVYYGRLLIIKTIEVASAIASTALAIGKGILAGATVLLTKSTWAQTTAQLGLNGAMYACPIVWIVIAIMALIAIIFAVCAAIAKFTGVAKSGFGVVCGVVAMAGAFIYNTMLGAINGIVQLIWTAFVTPFLGIIEWVLNVCNGGFDSFGDAVANLIGQIISWFLDLGKVVTKIIDAIFNTDWTSGLNSLQDSVIAWGKNENAITLPRDAPELTSSQRIEYGKAFDAGAKWGDNISNSIGNFMDGLFDGDKYLKDLQWQTNENTSSSYDGSDAKDSAKKTAKNTKKIADNTAKTTDLLSLVKDNLEKEIVARYTSGNNIINDFSGMTNNYNNRNESQDFIQELSDYLRRQQEKSTEGV